MDRESHAGSSRVEITGRPKWTAEKRKLEQKVGGRFMRPAFSTDENQTKSPADGDGGGMREGGPSMIYVRGGADTMGE